MIHVRALIVEDEVKMAGLIRRGLIEKGYAAEIASTGEDALWMAGATEYDAIVLDKIGCRRPLRSAGEETDRISQLAEDLLVLARSDDGNPPVQSGHLSAHDRLTVTAMRFQARAEAAGRTIVVDGLDVAIGDRLRLEQALGNSSTTRSAMGQERSGSLQLSKATTSGCTSPTTVPATRTSFRCVRALHPR